MAVRSGRIRLRTNFGNPVLPMVTATWIFGSSPNFKTCVPLFAVSMLNVFQFLLYKQVMVLCAYILGAFGRPFVLNL